MNLANQSLAKKCVDVLNDSSLSVHSSHCNLGLLANNFLTALSIYLLVYCFILFPFISFTCTANAKEANNDAYASDHNSGDTNEDFSESEDVGDFED